MSQSAQRAEKMGVEGKFTCMVFWSLRSDENEEEMGENGGLPELAGCTTWLGPESSAIREDV